MNVESRDELTKNAIEKVAEANESDTLEISFDADNAELLTLLEQRKILQVSHLKSLSLKKIIKISDGDISISYKVGDAK